MKSRIFERMIQENLFLYKNLRSIGKFINKIRPGMTSNLSVFVEIVYNQ